MSEELEGVLMEQVGGIIAKEGNDEREAMDSDLL